ncbi:MAG: uncharacterized protein QOI47_2315 [Actinomycetota bacterium]|nr:uncharacterized protein [Actinomycetota bacterium]
MADLHRLLDLQDRDLSIDQLRHRRDSMPDRGALAVQHATISRLDGELGAFEVRLDEQRRALKRIEDEVAAIETKARSETRKLNSGTITAPREIQALSDEIDALGRRQRVLEDEELEIMEAVESLTGEIDALTAQRHEATVEADRLRASIEEQEESIDTELAAVTAERAEALLEIPDDLLARYERLRSKLDGIAVARLDGDRCLGCHISLPAMEVDAVRHAPDDAVVTHEECGRILVR